MADAQQTSKLLLTYCVIDYSDVMTQPVECLNVFESVGRLQTIVDDVYSHNGYPVVDDFEPTSVCILNAISNFSIADEKNVVSAFSVPST